MKIVILNGSPKGEYSNTIHYMKYIMKHRPGHEYRIIEVGRDIKKIEKDPGMLDDILGNDKKFRRYPVVISALSLLSPVAIDEIHRDRFRTRGLEEAFHDKYATALTTSVHFYDHLAHHYINADLRGYGDEVH